MQNIKLLCRFYAFAVRQTTRQGFAYTGFRSSNPGLSDAFFFSTLEKRLPNSGLDPDEVPVELSYLSFLPVWEHFSPKEALIYNDIGFSEFIRRIKTGKGEIDLIITVSKEKTPTSIGIELNLSGKERLLAYVAMFYFEQLDADRGDKNYGIEMPTKNSKHISLTTIPLKSYLKILKTTKPKTSSPGNYFLIPAYMPKSTALIEGYLINCDVHSKHGSVTRQAE